MKIAKFYTRENNPLYGIKQFILFSDGCDSFQSRFACNGKCYLEITKCDGIVNCPTGADENGCTGKRFNNSPFQNLMHPG